MATRSKALMWATMKRCGTSSKGCRIDPSDGIVALLIKSGLLTIRSSGFVAITVKGRQALKRAARAPKKKPAVMPKRTGNPGTAMASRRGDTGGATATILRFRRR